MALIKCPECSNEVSDQAASCPKCGYPLKAATPPLSTDLDSIITQTLLREGKIAAIKLYRNRTSGAGLADSKQYVDRLEARLPAGTVPKPAQSGCAAIVAFGSLFTIAVVGLVIYLYFKKGSGF